MFKFNNISSDDMDLIVESLPPISGTEERIDSINIPGGTQILQSNGYDLIDKKCVCHYSGMNFDRLLTWLRGNGKVVFDNLPDRYYKAYIGNKIPLEQIVRNLLHKFTVIFTCKPFGYLLEGDIPIELNEPTVLCNVKSTHESYPTIKICGTGAATFTINSRTFNITNIDNEITIVSDPDIQKVLNKKGKYMEGNFPYLDIGENKISWTGNITNVEIIPYWRTWI
ncbi:phage tail protein [uncultured Clostridium sp.]|uniref:phage tail protein n=1 Tax=uncultured Clostridium sp. TaxID=59620 RepID=UPI0025E4F79A|nr:phage tail protein [uncultured Clostridium sp.]